MSTKFTPNKTEVRTFKFDVNAGTAPYAGVKRDALTSDQKDARTVHFDTRAGMQIDLLLDTLHTCKTREERESCVVTFLGECADNNYSLGRVARAHGAYKPVIDPSRSENKVKSAVRDVNAMSADELAAVLQAAQERIARLSGK